MDCSEIRENLYDYQMKWLDKTTFREVEKHLKGCRNCRSEFEELQKILSLLDQWKSPELSKDFKDRLMERIESQPRPSFEGIIDKLFRPIYLKLPLKGLAVALGIFLVLTVYHGVFTPEIEKIPKELKLSIPLPEVKNPIVVETEDVGTAFTRLVEMIETHNGKLIGQRKVDQYIEVAFKIEPGEQRTRGPSYPPEERAMPPSYPLEEEKILFKELNKLGMVHIEEEGYRDQAGNIVVILKRSSTP